MTRLAALCVSLLLCAPALARPPDCYAQCDNDRKNCEVQCAKKAGHHATTCKSACAQVTDPCRDACKKREERRK